MLLSLYADVSDSDSCYHLCQCTNSRAVVGTLNGICLLIKQI